MLKYSTIELIRPNGLIEFYPLDERKGIVNIGQDPSNDIVIEAVGVGSLHAILDYQRSPYQLMLISPSGDTRLNNQRVTPNTPIEFSGGQTLEIEGHILFLLETSKEIAIVPTPSSGAELAQPEPFVKALVTYPVRPGDETDEVIVTDFPTRDATVVVGQTSFFNLTLINGGGIVAAFEIEVEGIDPSWVSIQPPKVNLLEGSKANATINITPPRQPGSLAGPHHFAVVITSPNHPGRRCIRGATLNIQPYQEFSIGELSPRQMRVSWTKPGATTGLQLTNLGNCQTNFKLEGADDEKALDFEFHLPDGQSKLATRAQITLEPQQSVRIPIQVTSRVRSFIGLTNHQHSFTITTNPAESQDARILLGHLSRSPLIGPLWIVLIILLLIGLIVFTFWPKITMKVEPAQIVAGQRVYVEWSASPPFLVDVTLDEEAVAAPSGRLLKTPIKTTTYQIKANTWLSKIFPTLAATSSAIVTVDPVKPEIMLFEAQPDHITGANQNVTLSWMVLDADEVVLVDQTAGKEVKLDKPYGAVTYKLEKGVVYQLKAKNNSMPEQPVVKELDVPVIVPKPVVDMFMVSPETVNVGEKVKISWKVTNAPKLTIDPAGKDLPPSGEIVVTPKETTAYVLSASNGVDTIQLVKQVVVNPKPADPVAPAIDAFTATPDKSAGAASVRLDWSISGYVTKIELTDGESVWSSDKKADNYDEAITLKGHKNFSVESTMMFTLTAFNGSLQTVKTAKVTIDPVPPPVIASFTVSPEKIDPTQPVMVYLNWLVTGKWTKIVLTYDDQIFSTDPKSIYYDDTLKAQGSKVIPDVTKPTMYVLTAYNGSSKVSVTVLIAE